MALPFNAFLFSLKTELFTITELKFFLLTIADLKLLKPDTLFTTKVCADDDDNKFIPYVPVEFITLLIFCVPFIVKDVPLSSPKSSSIVCIPAKEYSLFVSSDSTASFKESNSAKSNCILINNIKDKNKTFNFFMFSPIILFL